MSIAVFTSFEQLLNNSGDPLNGGSVTVYSAGTTTPLTLYNNTDLGGGHTTTNPITLDAYGRHAMTYISAVAYKVLVKDSGGSTLATYDNIDPAVPLGTGVLAITNGGTGASSASAAVAALGAATAAEVADVAADVAALAGTLGSNEKTHIATGTTGQRPASPIEGDFRRNTTLHRWEYYDGVGWRNCDPTVQRFTSSTGTYTTPAGCIRLRVRMVGPGGGGGASATNSGAAGSADTSFGSWTAVKGSGGIRGDSTLLGGAGGTGGTDSTGTKIIRVDGEAGQGGHSTSGGDSPPGGRGGSTFFGGGGAGNPQTAGAVGKANTGGGGSGAGPTNAASAGGGGGGEYVEFVIVDPTSTYSYVVGAGGAGGSAGGTAGGAGAAGVIIVEEFYI